MGLGLLGNPGHALAQDGPSRGAVRGNNAETAREMYEQAMQLSEEERWQEAADIFQRLLDTRWSMQIAYNHANALVKLGKLLRATRLLEKVIAEAEADATSSPASEQIRIVADMLLSQAEPELGQLTVEADGDAQSAVVVIDGMRRVGTVGTPIAVDPGTHSVMLRRGGGTTEPQEVTLGGDEPLEVTITIETSGLGPAPENTSLQLGGAQAGGDEEGFTASSPADTDAAFTGDDNLLHKWWFWSAGGAVVVVGTVLIVALAVSSGSDGVAPPPSTGSGVVVTTLELP